MSPTEVWNTITPRQAYAIVHEQSDRGRRIQAARTRGPAVREVTMHPGEVARELSQLEARKILRKARQDARRKKRG